MKIANFLIEIAFLKKKKEDIEKRIKATQKKQKHSKKDKDILQQKINDLTNDIEDINKQIEELQKSPSGVFEFIKKNPIYCHVYFSNLDNKSELYNTIIRAYNVFGDSTCNSTNGITGTLQNLKTNGENYKRFVIAINYLNLFVNSYVKEMATLYEKQNLSEGQFYEELFTPYYDDILHYRIKPYYDRIFNRRYMENVIKPKFIIPWKAFGKLIRNTIKRSIKMMFTHQKTHNTKAVESPATMS